MAGRRRTFARSLWAFGKVSISHSGFSLLDLFYSWLVQGREAETVILVVSLLRSWMSRDWFGEIGPVVLASTSM